MEHEIGIWFLLLSLVFPRMVLFFWWMTENLPFNTTPFIADFFTSFFFPRILILVYIYDIQGMSTWFIIHLVGMAVAYLANIGVYVSKINKEA